VPEFLQSGLLIFRSTPRTEQDFPAINFSGRAIRGVEALPSPETCAQHHQRHSRTQPLGKPCRSNSSYRFSCLKPRFTPLYPHSTLQGAGGLGDGQPLPRNLENLFKSCLEIRRAPTKCVACVVYAPSSFLCCAITCMTNPCVLPLTNAWRARHTLPSCSSRLPPAGNIINEGSAPCPWPLSLCKTLVS